MVKSKIEIWLLCRNPPQPLSVFKKTLPVTGFTAHVLYA